MLRQMRTLYARSNRIIRIFHNCSANLGEAFVDHFTVVTYGLKTISPLFSKIRVAYNNFYSKILHVPPHSSASKLFVDNNIPNVEALLRKEVFSFTSRLSVSANLIIRAIENCWLIKYVNWKPWHIDKLFL